MLMKTGYIIEYQEILSLLGVTMVVWLHRKCPNFWRCILKHLSGKYHDAS